MSKKSDLQLKNDVEAELLWDPRINAAQVGVSVDAGVIALSGAVDSYAAKWAAEDAVKRIAGVRVLAQDLTVKVPGAAQRSDSDIAAAALSALRWDVWVPHNVTAKVQRGAITLEGRVEWNYQRESAERAMRNISGVVAVNNAILLNGGASSAQVKEKVESALLRRASNDAKSIEVHTSGGTVTLTGQASSWHAIEDAAHAAWAAPGVTDVVDSVVMAGF